MEVKIIKDEKDLLVLEIDNSTLAELLRAYLNKDDSVVLAAWKKEHADKNAVFEIKTRGKTARKALNDALALIQKELDKYSEEFKKAIK